MPENLIYGLIDLEVKVASAGGTATVTIYLPNPAPDDYKWFKYDPDKGWYDYSANAVFNEARDQVTLTLVDGGTDDADGTANGTIVVSSGICTVPAKPPTVTTITPTPPPDLNITTDSNPTPDPNVTTNADTTPEPSPTPDSNPTPDSSSDTASDSTTDSSSANNNSSNERDIVIFGGCTTSASKGSVREVILYWVGFLSVGWLLRRRRIRA
jgi:hypothetical protein